jgi:hypothetical protein
MDQQKPPDRTCPVCGSPNYSFRSRKQIEPTAKPGAGAGDEVLLRGL